MQNQTFKLSLKPNDYPPNVPYIYADQYDEGRTFVATVYDADGSLYNFNGETVTVVGTKPSGTGFSYTATASGNTVTFETTGQMTVVAGNVTCGIIIEKDGDRIGTLHFVLHVQPAALSSDTIIDSDDFGSIISDAVAEYMEEHGIVIDPTLTVAGAAADAKATGDAIDELKSAIESYKFDELFSELQISEAQNLYNKDTAEDGYIAANGNISSSTTYCYSDKIPVEVGKTYTFWALYNGAVVSANARFLCAYDSNGDAVSSAGSNSAVASYTVPDEIASIVVSFERNRKHLFMVVDGTTEPDELLPYNLEHYIASTNFISEAVGNILRGNVSLKMTVDTASAGTDYKLAEHLDNKKNCGYSFFGKFSAFTSIEIGHGKTESGANYLVIDNTNITSYRPNGTEYAHYAHNLTISDFISVSIKNADTVSQRATVTIITNGGSATIGNVIFFGCNGAIYFNCGQETTSVEFEYNIMDLRKDVYVFGDSYISLADDKRWPNYAIANNDNNLLLSGFPGADDEEEYPSFEQIISMGTPKYLCWFLGMNDPDGASAISANWLTITSQVVSICKAKGIVPILATIPNTPTQRHTYKNAWVKASGERYVDFAKAVGAEDAGASWYTGMLSSDNVHPTAEGAKALWLQMRMDVPEIMQPTTT